MKNYIGASIFIIALLVYSLPWYFGEPYAVLGLYGIALVWFLVVGWLVLVYQLYSFVVLKKRNNPTWKHHLIASFIIIVSYIGYIWGISNGYMLRV